jgi:hypothetical protein
MSHVTKQPFDKSCVTLIQVEMQPFDPSAALRKRGAHRRTTVQRMGMLTASALFILEVKVRLRYIM